MQVIFQQYSSYVQVTNRLGNQQVAKDPMQKLFFTNTLHMYELKLA